MRIKLKYISLIFILMGAIPLFAQNQDGSVNVRFSVPEIAVLDVEPEHNNIEFSVVASVSPGGEPEVKQLSGESIWLNYSSAIRGNGNTRSINAQLAGNSIPDGISFFIEASAPSALGSVNQGTSAGRVEISEEPRPIVTGIGSCFTGDGVNMGHELTYSVEITDFEKVKSESNQVFTVVYTITDN